MKRFLALLLVMILPLQFSFAAASAYCADEVAVESTGHYGHHDHGDAHEPVSSDVERKPAGHAECGVCHLGCAKLLSAPVTMASLKTELPNDMPLLLSTAQTQPSPLQRPPIASLA